MSGAKLTATTSSPPLPQASLLPSSSLRTRTEKPCMFVCSLEAAMRASRSSPACSPPWSLSGHPEHYRGRKVDPTLWLLRSSSKTGRHSLHCLPSRFSLARAIQKPCKDQGRRDVVRRLPIRMAVPFHRSEPEKSPGQTEGFCSRISIHGDAKSLGLGRLA